MGEISHAFVIQKTKGNDFMKIKKLLACFICAVVCMAWCGISVNATETAIYKHFDVTDTNYTADTKLELNSIDDGLTAAINDVCQNYKGCEVTFRFKQTTFADNFGYPTARLTGNGFSFMSDTVKADGNYITFAFDNVNYNHKMWGNIFQLTFEATTDIIITDVYVYVPEQEQLADLSAGAAAYETVRILC